VDGGPARFEFSSGQARSLRSGFVAFYGLVEGGLILAAVFRRELVVVAVVFGVTLVLWRWQLSRATSHPWSLIIGVDRVELESGGERTIATRAEAVEARLRRRRMRYAAWTELVISGRGGERLLVAGLHGPDVPEISAALRERGWPPVG